MSKGRKEPSNGRRLSAHAKEIEQILKENEAETLDLKFLSLGPGMKKSNPGILD